MPANSSHTIHETVEQLQVALDGFRSDAPDMLAAAVERYASTVVDVNRRLRAAHALLKKGRRADAIHACDAEPNVLETVAELDFADQALESWQQTLDEAGITRPPRLLTDIAADLSSAYDTRHRLAHLMRQHRLLAIGRGPLEVRVRVLRQIVETDPDTPDWSEDLAVYEGAWKADLSKQLAEIETLAAERITTPVVQRAKALVAQLSSAEWIEPLDADVVRRAQGTLGNVVKTRARVELAAIAAELAAAHRAGDFQRAETLFDRWQDVAARCPPLDTGPVLAAAQDCLRWVSGQRQHAAMSAAAEEAAEEVRVLVRQRVPATPAPARGARDRLAAAVQRLSATLASDADEYDDILAAAEVRLGQLGGVAGRFWGTLAAGLTLAVVLTGVASVATIRQTHRRRVVAAVSGEVVDHCVERKQGWEARQRWKDRLQRDPWLDSHPIASRVAEELHALEQQAKEARDAINDRLVADARVLIDTDLPARIAELESVQIAKTTSDAIRNIQRIADRAASDADRLLKKADQDLAFISAQLGDSKTREVADRIEKLRGDHRARTTAYSEAVRAMIFRIRDQIDRDLVAIETASEPGSRAEVRTRLRDRISDLEQLTDRPQADLIARIERLAGKDRDRDRVVALMHDLDRAARNSLDDYLRAIDKAVAAEDPATPLGSLRRVQATRPAIEGALLWSKAADEWNGNLDCKTDARARWRSALRAALDAESQPTGSKESADKAEQLLSCLDDRDEPPNLALLKRILAEKVMQPEVLVVGTARGNYYTTPDESKKRSCFRDSTLLGRYCEQADRARERAPHLPLAAEILRRIEAIEESSTSSEEGLIGILTLFGDPEYRRADTTLQCTLIGRLIEAMEGQQMFTGIQALETLADRLADDIGTAPRWIDPENRDHEVAKEAEDIVNRSGLVGKVIAEYHQRRKALEERPGCCVRLKFIGWLNSSTTPHQLRLGNPVPDANGKLYVVAIDDDGAFHRETIGTIRSGTPTLAWAAANQFGQPVFLMQPPDKSATDP